MSYTPDRIIGNGSLSGNQRRPLDHLAGWTDLGNSRRAKPRKADEAYCRLKDLILTSELSPGAMLDERDLMERLDIGRTPLREAIQRLAHDRLVSIAPRKGSWVSELSIAELRELIAARELVEPPVAASAATRITGSEIDVLRQIVEEADRALCADDLLAAIQCDRAFHHRLALAGGNTYLAHIVDQINTTTLRYWHVSFMYAGETGQSYNHHYRIVECLEEGEPLAVEAVMREHIDIFRRRVQQVLGGRI